MSEFQHGLFGCFDNCLLCVITYVVPCYTAGKVAEKVGESCITYGILSVVPVANIICGAKIREKVRAQKNIDGTFMNDCLMHWCCACCAYVQEAQEVNALDSQTMARE